MPTEPGTTQETEECEILLPEHEECEILLPEHEDTYFFPELTVATLEKFKHTLGRINNRISDSLEPHIESFRVFLFNLIGRSYETFEENQEAAKMIQSTAHRLGVLFACTKCGAPSKFRCYKPEKSKAGHFQFEHIVNGSWTKHGAGSAIPELKLISEEKS